MSRNFTDTKHIFAIFGIDAKHEQPPRRSIIEYFISIFIMFERAG